MTELQTFGNTEQRQNLPAVGGEVIELYHLSDAYSKVHSKFKDAKLFEDGILFSENSEEFKEAVAKHRFRNRKIC